jgi:hypothetical protein
MKTSKTLVILFSIFLIIIGILLFFTCWTNETKSLISQYAGVIVTGVGFIIAIYQLKLTSDQYFADLIKNHKDFLDLEIQTSSVEGFYSVKTQVINKSGENKGIDFAFVLITEQEENIVNSIQTVIKIKRLNIEIKQSNDFDKLKDFIDRPTFINKSIGIIPIKFYYLENITIANENPGYTYTFDNSNIGLKKGIYSARFFIYPLIGYHRSTVGSLIIK